MQGAVWMNTQTALSRLLVISSWNILILLFEKSSPRSGKSKHDFRLGVGVGKSRAKHPTPPAHEMALVLSETGVLWPPTSGPFRLTSKEHPIPWPHLLAVLEEVLKLQVIF